MSIKFISPKKSVNSAFLKLPVPVEKMEDFKLSLKALYGKRDPKKDEEYHKNELQAFLKKIFDPAYLVQVKRPIDLAIYNGNDANAKPAVIIEMKSPTNHSEMFSELLPNTKALQELVYYFLLEYVHFGNREIKHLVISNFDDRKAYFENLRIPLNNTELLQQLATLADEIIAAKKSLSQPKGPDNVIASESEAIQRNIATLETQVNTLVYQLYGITDAEEVEAVEKR